MSSEVPAATGPILDPEMILALEKARSLSFVAGPPPQDTEVFKRHMASVSAWWNEGGPRMTQELTVQIPGPRGNIEAILYRPTADVDVPVFVYLHGGGFKIGNAGSNARQMRELAAAWGGAVISLDYAHLPEHRFPVPVVDTAHALLWLHKNAGQWGIDTGRMAIGGTSAGAHIALGVIGELNGQLAQAAPFVFAVVLVTPVVNGDANTASMHLFGQGPHFPFREATIATWREYTNGEIGADLLHVNPKLLPPVFVSIAEVDVFRDAGNALFEHLNTNGEENWQVVYPGVTHLFFGYSRLVSQARKCIKNIANFLILHKDWKQTRHL